MGMTVTKTILANFHSPILEMLHMTWASKVSEKLIFQDFPQVNALIINLVVKNNVRPQCCILNFNFIRHNCSLEEF